MLRRTAVAALAMAVAGCAMGPPPPKPPDYASWSRVRKATAARPARVLIPRARSPEYLRSWGVRMVNPDSAFRAGFTGQGVTVALIDTGVKWAQPEVTRQISPASVDLVDARLRDDREARHGAEVAGGFSAALDGGGLVGLSYGATLLSIRADIDGSCATECTFYVRDVIRGLDYAVEKGARVIVLAVVGRRRMSPPFEAAMERAAKSGAVMVIAAGNDKGADPAWPARYAADPRFSRAVIVAGAAAQTGELASWSNRAGVTADRFISAPGERLITNCDERFCELVSGTSFSASYVAGALALILQARPDLSPQDAAGVLLRNAAPQSAKRREVGQGLLDIGRAFEAARRVKTTSVAQAG